MSRTTRRGKPSRNFHKYIGLGVIRQENRRVHVCHSIPGGWHTDLSDDPEWFEDGYKSYDEYAEEKIRHYHMDYRRWTKFPGHVNRLDIEYHRRQCKRALYEAMRYGEFDVILPTMGKVGQRIWDWW